MNITISKKKYDSLIKDKYVLDRLYAAGVENWEWYDAAFENDEEDESDED